MNKDEYAARLKSQGWRTFSARLHSHGGHLCHMCGSRDKIQCHHMRYYSLGTPREWQDIVLACDRCHDAYHARHRFMPTFRAPRHELLAEMATALMYAGIDPKTYFDHGDELNTHWLAKKIVVDELLIDGSRGKAKRQGKKKPIEQLRRMYWNSRHSR